MLRSVRYNFLDATIPVSDPIVCYASIGRMNQLLASVVILFEVADIVINISELDETVQLKSARISLIVYKKPVNLDPFKGNLSSMYAL